jgi:hypothetical protein
MPTGRGVRQWWRRGADGIYGWTRESLEMEMSDAAMAHAAEEMARDHTSYVTDI